MSKEGIMRFFRNRANRSATEREILRVFPKHRWGAVQRELEDLVRSTELMVEQIDGKTVYTPTTEH